jgi:hypothetical protein
MNVILSTVLRQGGLRKCSTADLRICFRMLLKMILNEQHQHACYMIRNCTSRRSCLCSLFSLLYGDRKLLSGQPFNIFPWKYFSITSIRNPIIYPATSSTKIGATVSKLTTIADGSVLGCVEGR